MFPINFNFPYRKKDGSIITMEKALDGAGADLDLIDLDDVAITDPAEDDGLVYDSTSQKWENVPIVTQAQNDILGSKNVAVGAFHNGTENGITWTVDSDNVVTITSSTGSVGPVNITSDEFILPKGTWILSKNPIQIPNIRIALLVSGSAVAITYDEEIAYYASSDTKCRIRLYVPSTTGALNVMFYPMLRPSIVKDNSYAPPAKTNKELTDDTSIKFYDLSSAKGTNVTFLSASAVKLGDMVFLQGHWTGSNNSSEPILTVPQELNPEATKVYGYGMAKFSTGYVTGEYSLKNSGGNLYQSISSSAGTEGEFSVIYSISKSTT